MEITMSIEIVGEGEATSEPQHRPLTDAEVSEIAKDYYSGHIFGSWQLTGYDKNLVGSVFMILLFLDDITTKQLLNDGAVHCYEHLSQAGPTAINGYPTFFSCRFITTADLERVLAKAREIKAVMDKL